MSNSIIMSGLARLLLQQKTIGESELSDLASQAKENEPFSSLLVRTKRLTASDLSMFLVNTFSYPYIDLSQVDIMSLPSLLDLKIVRKHRVLPLAKKGQTIFVATSDPTNPDMSKDIKFQTQCNVVVIVAEEDKFATAWTKYIESKDTSLSSALDGMDGMNLDAIFAEEDSQEAEISAETSEVDDAPIVQYLNKILLDAIKSGVSDIHFEPYEKMYRIRYRQDGVLYEAATPTMLIKDKLAARVKVISRMNIAEKRVPQDGRMKMVLSKDKAIDFRVSTLPVLWGEKIVMRILDPSSATLGIEALGYEAVEKERLMSAIHRPYGMVLVTGPTGSGKTVSLYTCLNILNTAEINISTAEDPAEINLPGINQVNVDDKAGLTFPIALKAFLRQDPDIIMVGEIRDIETADIAIKAAQTGHMVLSTLHTNDAPSTLVRLRNMGVKPFNIASSVILITAQRLARRLCKCKKEVTYEKEVLQKAGFTEEQIATYGHEWKSFGKGGCEICKGTGYKGRVGVYQVMPITEEMREIILREGTDIEIAREAKKIGVGTLRESGLVKVMQGLTSIEEIASVTNE